MLLTRNTKDRHPLRALGEPMAKHVRLSQLGRLTAVPTVASKPIAQSLRCFSVLQRPRPNYEGHIPLTRTERLGLALGSGLMSFLDPRRGGKLSQLTGRDNHLTLPRSHRILRRGDCSAILHLQAARPYASESYR